MSSTWKFPTLLIIGLIGVVMLGDGPPALAGPAIPAPDKQEPILDLAQITPRSGDRLYGPCHNCPTNCRRSHDRCITFGGQRGACVYRYRTCIHWCRRNCTGRRWGR